MKILMVNPCIRTGIQIYKQLYPMPLGLVSVASYLRKHGYKDINLVDFLIPPDMKVIKNSPPSFKGKRRRYLHYGQSYEEVERWAMDNQNKYDVIGFTTHQVNTAEDGFSKVASIFRKYFDGHFIAGGFSATSIPNFISKYTDYIIRGEGETPFLKLINDLEQGNEPPKGVYNNNFQQIDDLDELPFPAWDLVDLEKYPLYNNKKRIVVSSSRGCPYDCTFCAVKTMMGCDNNGGYKPRWRPHSSEYTIKLIQHLYKDYDIRYFCFVDDNFLANRERALMIARGLKELKMKNTKYYIEEGMTVRQAKDRELIGSLKESGFEGFAIGLETLSQKTVENIKKPFFVQEFTEAINVFKDYELTPKVFYILGFLGDTIQSMIESMMELSKFKVEVRVNNLHLLPLTDLWNAYEKAGLIPTNYDYRLSSFYTLPTPDFDFNDILDLRRILNGVNYGTKQGVDVFGENCKTIMDKLNIVLEKDTIKAPRVFYRDGPYISFLKILAYRLGFNSVKVIKTDKHTLLKDGYAKSSKVDKVLKQMITDEVPERVIQTRL